MNSSDTHQIKRALISVSDKNGIIEFARELTNLGIEIYSTGGTATLLMNEAIPVKFVSDLTGFPEILGGRVKTLHPSIHAGILADLGNQEHLNQLEELKINSIDLLVVNLYPFEDALNKKNLSENELIEFIDIGGPTMLRAAAKNYLWTIPIVNPDNYSTIITILRENNCTVPVETRKTLAREVFEHTAYYDSIIAQHFQKSDNIQFPEKLTIPMKKEQKLRYGENPHQDAALYGNFTKIFRQIHGKELSYNNIVDIDAAAKLIVEFDQPTFGLIKHTNPCGVGTADTLKEAYAKAFATDTESPYGGIFVVNRPIDLETAETIHTIFSEVIIAPEFSEDALTLLTKKKDRRLISVDMLVLANSFNMDIKSVTKGFLMQNTDTKRINSLDLKIVSKRQPTEEELTSLIFGWKVVKHVKSNAVIYTKSDRTIAIGAGQTSRIDSSRIAVEKSKLMGLDLKGTTVASDAYFPFADGLLQAVEAGATAVIQPGGSVRDEEVIKACNEYNIAMVFTGVRHFKH